MGQSSTPITHCQPRKDQTRAGTQGFVGCIVKSDRKVIHLIVSSAVVSLTWIRPDSVPAMAVVVAVVRGRGQVTKAARRQPNPERPFSAGSTRDGVETKTLLARVKAPFRQIHHQD